MIKAVEGEIKYLYNGYMIGLGNYSSNVANNLQAFACYKYSKIYIFFLSKSTMLYE